MVHTIKAIRDGEKKEFDLDTWKMLPENKYGWKVAAEEPEEVTAIKKSHPETTPHKPAHKKK